MKTRELSEAEKRAYEAGKTAADRIGEKPMCYDPIMNNLIIEARSPRGIEYNRKIMKAWLYGRGWENLIPDEIRSERNET